MGGVIVLILAVLFCWAAVYANLWGKEKERKRMKNTKYRVCPGCDTEYMYVGKYNDDYLAWLQGISAHTVECGANLKNDDFNKAMDLAYFAEDVYEDIKDYAVARAMSLHVESKHGK